ncbi:hypothetical protein CgunFtcFv8_017479 [Champsocephalus gunnari]|uniref:Uncharacterized protein n=1 Tax=Champsocephalus gunnari TaxID=52237 RepID=A0AAN8DMU7_CHAGU|nr:hypothetical protein CgunFtcFv8_017479 [Champsocephalus gunnari]
MIPPPLFLQPPVDKSFSFIAQTQGLQVHRPQKGAKKGGSAGVKEGMGRRMVSGEIREEGTEPPYPGLTSTPIHPTPHVPNPATLLFGSTALPYMKVEQTVMVPPGATRPPWCVWQRAGGRRGRGAMWR